MIFMNTLKKFFIIKYSLPEVNKNSDEINLKLIFFFYFKDNEIKNNCL